MFAARCYLLILLHVLQSIALNLVCLSHMSNGVLNSLPALHLMDCLLLTCMLTFLLYGKTAFTVQKVTE